MTPSCAASPDAMAGPAATRASQPPSGSAPQPPTTERESGLLPHGPGSGALRRLSCLPTELQDMVIRHLPLADILVWYRLNRNFRHRITVGCLREQAFCRVLGPGFPRVAFSKENQDELLPWLASFPAHPSSLNRQAALNLQDAPFRPGRLLCALTRTLRRSPHLVLSRKQSFTLQKIEIRSASFSPDGRYITVSGTWPVAGSCHREWILERDSRGWHRGCAFTGVHSVDRVCFAADARRVAVADGSADVLVWDRVPGNSVAWQQTACLATASAQNVWVAGMTFSPHGRWLAVSYRGGSLRLWHEDGWSLRAQFSSRHASSRHYQLPFSMAPFGPDDVFSPDERWMLLLDYASRQLVLLGLDETGLQVPFALTDPDSGRTATSARFHQAQGQLQLFAVLSDNSLLLMQHHQGQWYRQHLMQHPDGISALRFSPDGQWMITRCVQAGAGAVLWAQDAGQRWQPRQALGAEDPDTTWLNAVYFDPCSRWIMAGTESVMRRDDNRLAMWRYQGGVWIPCPKQIICPVLGWELAITADGQHLACVSREALYLMEAGSSAWTTKARRCHRPGHFFAGVSMDPFGCYLAALSTDGKSIDLLRAEACDEKKPEIQWAHPIPGLCPPLMACDICTAAAPPQLPAPLCQPSCRHRQPLSDDELD